MAPRLSTREFKPSDTKVQVGGVEIGGKRLVVIGGPCTVEAKESLFKTALAIRDAGAHMLRGGAFKVRTNHDDFQGLGDEGLKLLAEARASTGLPVATEVIDPRDVELVAGYADMLQVGSRNMQNTALLKEVGRSRLPVLLKRGFANTIDEWLSSADYILAEGNSQVVLCERGIRTFETSTRFSLDILAIPLVKMRSHLPIIVDPSHAAGIRELVPAVAKAAVAAGADGLIIEVNWNPHAAKVDGQQTISTTSFADLMNHLRVIAPSLGKEF